MKNYIRHDEWSIIEEGFDPKLNRISESLFSLGNGRMGQRANFEETYTGDSLSGNYVAGVYYPDKTRVGWWKNGYPEYFAKVLNSANWVGIDVKIDGETLDLSTCEVKTFSRRLNLREGVLERHFVARMPSGREVEVWATRFCSMAEPEIGAIRYRIVPLNFDGRIQFDSFVDFDVRNEDSNYGERFWEEVEKVSIPRKSYITCRTKKTDFHVCTGMKFTILQNGVKAYFEAQPYARERYVGNLVSVMAVRGKETVIEKFAGVVSSLYRSKEGLMDYTREKIKAAAETGFDRLMADHKAAWAKIWEECDITIEGDTAAQQGIRFNIFHLNQTYRGDDDRLNIGPKGFTGEKYGGSTYWDTEAYCLPFYMSTHDPKVARQLLVYRYRHLDKAIENARQLGFTGGAALFPMVTMNGEECHNEWEITFEEIHRNGAIAYAIHDYVRYTGDESVLAEFGAEVLIGIARFWAQRVNFSKEKKKFVILGVTGPNEYENNVNNNWYTNYIAAWCMDYAREVLAKVEGASPFRYAQILESTAFDAPAETARWAEISENMYYPSDKKLGVFLQQDGYLDKELLDVDELSPADRPLNQKWSWDRILRSCFIKQADVLQGLYFFEERFDLETLRRNFDFYEPKTVHESSLSPCVHVILASRLGYRAKAYALYLRTARLDLDDYNNDTEDGLHITSMAGTWMSVVKGFGGMRAVDGKLSLSPYLPEQWKGFSFKIRFREHLFRVAVSSSSVDVENLSDTSAEIVVHGKHFRMSKRDVLVVPLGDS